MTIEAVAMLTTSANDGRFAGSEEQPATRAMGGTRVYAADDEILDEGLKHISAAIILCSESQSCINSNYLLHLVRRELKTEISMTLYRACIGAECRLGTLERHMCQSSKGASFRIVVALSRLNDFRSQLEQALSLALQSTTVKVRDVQDLFFPSREKGTWFIATLILQRLAYLGFLAQVDNWSFSVPELLSDAAAKTNGKLITPDAAWLA